MATTQQLEGGTRRIELLLVVLIVSLLATIVAVSLDGPLFGTASSECGGGHRQPSTTTVTSDGDRSGGDCAG